MYALRLYRGWKVVEKQGLRLRRVSELSVLKLEHSDAISHAAITGTLEEAKGDNVFDQVN